MKSSQSSGRTTNRRSGVAAFDQHQGLAEVSRKTNRLAVNCFELDVGSLLTNRRETSLKLLLTVQLSVSFFHLLSVGRRHDAVKTAAKVTSNAKILIRSNIGISTLFRSQFSATINLIRRFAFIFGDTSSGGYLPSTAFGSTSLSTLNPMSSVITVGLCRIRKLFRRYNPSNTNEPPRSS